ncbi:hypothetical protein B0T24DRAFT_425970 [Lasiosphaeria ovina]|uniref:Uncharacterized protein n=1 Tax=Lasiosphaeria ovina TaxID=92902 RepID=A0AAE0MZC5_9PEZI|nr:hypothetical protein B0T24DRAFT_425970 [Lasiosphaeria ovina]
MFSPQSGLGRFLAPSPCPGHLAIPGGIIHAFKRVDLSRQPLPGVLFLSPALLPVVTLLACLVDLPCLVRTAPTLTWLPCHLPAPLVLCLIPLGEPSRRAEKQPPSLWTLPQIFKRCAPHDSRSRPGLLTPASTKTPGLWAEAVPRTPTP